MLSPSLRAAVVSTVLESGPVAREDKTTPSGKFSGRWSTEAGADRFSTHLPMVSPFDNAIPDRSAAWVLTHHRPLGMPAEIEGASFLPQSERSQVFSAPAGHTQPFCCERMKRRT